MIDVQTKMKSLFGGSCYGYCLAYVFGDPEQKDNIKYLTSCFLEGWKRGYIDDEGYVAYPLQYIQMLCGIKYKDVEKPQIKQLLELPDGPQIVELKNPFGGSHFVVCNNKGELLFDASGESESWKLNLPISYRKFIK